MNMNKQLIPPLAAIVVIMLKDILKMTDVDQQSVENAGYLLADIVAAVGIFLHPKKLDKPPDPPVK